MPAAGTHAPPSPPPLLLPLLLPLLDPLLEPLLEPLLLPLLEPPLDPLLPPLLPPLLEPVSPVELSASPPEPPPLELEDELHAVVAIDAAHEPAATRATATM